MDKLSTIKESISSYTDIGLVRSQNEDTYVVTELQSADNERIIILGVFDGHGGTTCSQYLADHLPQRLSNSIGSVEDQDQLKSDISETFQMTNQDFLEQYPHDISGSCAIVGMIYLSEEGVINLLTANVGDSRGVFSTVQNDNSISPSALNIEHKPYLPEEKKYIEQNGGRVFDGRLMGLAVSRAFGNKDLKDNGLRCTPEFVHKTVEDDTLIIYGSDGLWDVVSDVDAVSLVADIDTDDRARKLSKYALEKGSTDNVTSIVASHEQGSDQ